MHATTPIDGLIVQFSVVQSQFTVLLSSLQIPYDLNSTFLNVLFRIKTYKHKKVMLRQYNPENYRDYSCYHFFSSEVEKLGLIPSSEANEVRKIPVFWSLTDNTLCSKRTS
jgi:hypothetical protein